MKGTYTYDAAKNLITLNGTMSDNGKKVGYPVNTIIKSNKMEQKAPDGTTVAYQKE